MSVSAVDVVSAPWLGTLLGFLGLVAAVYFYRKSRRLPRLVYQTDEVTVIGGATAAFPEEIEIKFAGADVPQVTSSRIVIWNAGNVTLDGSAIVAADPLRLELKSEGEILRAEISRKTRDVNDIKLVRGSGPGEAVRLNFDYLDPQDGAVIEVFHSGTKKILVCNGSMRGLPQGIEYLGKAHWDGAKSNTGRATKLTISAFVIIFSLVGSFSIAEELFKPLRVIVHSESARFREPEWGMIAIMIPYALSAPVLFWRRRRKFPSRLAT